MWSADAGASRNWSLAISLITLWRGANDQDRRTAVAQMLAAIAAEGGPGATFRCTDPSRVDAGARSVIADPLEAAVVRYRGFYYHAQVMPPDDFLGLVTLSGTGTLATAREQVRFTTGDALLDPIDVPYSADMHDCAFAVLRVPRPVVGDLAEEHTGLPAADLRFESVAPVSASARASWSRTVAFICGQLVGSGITEINPILVQEMTRLAAAALLETFPNTAITAAYIPGPGRVPPATVRRAAAFIEAHAEQHHRNRDRRGRGRDRPGAAVHVPRHYGTTVTGYLRRPAGAGAPATEAADPTTGTTVAEIARRWGWASPANFTTAYRKQNRLPPSHTLRT